MRQTLQTYPYRHLSLMVSSLNVLSPKKSFLYRDLPNGLFLSFESLESNLLHDIGFVKCYTFIGQKVWSLTLYGEIPCRSGRIYYLKHTINEPIAIFLWR